MIADVSQLVNGNVACRRYADDSDAQGWVVSANNDTLRVRLANELLIHEGDEFVLSFTLEGRDLEVDGTIENLDRVEVILPMTPGVFDPNKVQVLTIDEIEVDFKLSSGFRKAVPASIEYVTMRQPVRLKKKYGEIDAVACHASDGAATVFSPLDLVSGDQLVLSIAKEDLEVKATVTKCKPSSEHPDMFRIEMELQETDRVLGSRWRSWVGKAKENFR